MGMRNIFNYDARIRSLLHYAASQTLKIEQLEIAQSLPLPEIILSIKVLIGALHNAFYDWMPGERASDVPYLPVLPSGLHKMSVSTRLLWSRMEHQGWCPSQIYSLFSKSDYFTLLFLSGLNRQRGNRMGKDHSNCSTQGCLADNVDMSKYETQHRVPHCKCNFVEVPKVPLVEIIKSGGIPLVSVHPGPHGTVEIYVEKAKHSTKYTTISHVWSDGLGNPFVNSLPQCQLEWLSNCLERLPPQGYQGIYYDDQYCNDFDSNRIKLDAGSPDNISQSHAKKTIPRFWIDTLCIPVDDKYSELRTKAIDKMVAYYAQAAGTLVLDSELQSLRIAVSTTQEILARIAHCAWASQCWTMQECAISQKCFFQFSDGTLQFVKERDMVIMIMSIIWDALKYCIRAMILERKSIIGSIADTMVDSVLSPALPTNSFLNNLFLEVILKDFQVRKITLYKLDVSLRVDEKEQNRRFVAIWNELSRRTTTKFEDIYVIMANLLDFDASQIMSLPADERIKAILWNGRYVPLSLLYSDGPRLGPGIDHLDRWVPTTPRGTALKPRPRLEFNEDGLLLPSSEAKARGAVMVLSNSQLAKGYCFIVHTTMQHDTGTMYLVKFIRAGFDEFQIDSSVATCYIFEQSEENLQDSCGPELKGTCLAVIEIKREETHGDQTDSRISQEETSNTCLRIDAKYDCPIRVWEVKHHGNIPVSEQASYNRLYETESAPTLQFDGLKSRWEVVLQTETTLPEPLLRRPSRAKPRDLVIAMELFALLGILFLGVPLNILLTVKWLQRLSPLSKSSIAAVVLFYCADLGCADPSFAIVIFPLFAIPAIIANCVNLAFGLHYEMGQIFIWAVLQFCVLFFPGILMYLLWWYGLRKYAYGAWLSTFDEGDWVENNKYKLWWKLLNLNSSHKRFRDAMEGIDPHEDVVHDPFIVALIISKWKQLKQWMPACFRASRGSSLSVELNENEIRENETAEDETAENETAEDARRMQMDIDHDNKVVERLLR